MSATREADAGSRAFRSKRLFAAAWDWMVRHEPKNLRAMREELLGSLDGRVLEIGCGTGANFAYYPPQVQVVASEPDVYMLERARRHLDDLGRSNVTLHQAPAEQLPFEDASFDHVVESWVLCHVRDVPASLGEVRRLLRPDGTFRFMEHVRDDGRVWGTLQDAANPVWKRLLGAGCNANRRTQQALESAGFRIEWVRQEPSTFPTSPCIYGIARPM